MVPTSVTIKDYVYEWAEHTATLGKHLIGYKNGMFTVFSNDETFKEIITKRELG